nr:hypothetical protein [Tanacetum cinerariifolium]
VNILGISGPHLGPSPLISLQLASSSNRPLDTTYASCVVKACAQVVVGPLRRTWKKEVEPTTLLEKPNSVTNLLAEVGSRASVLPLEVPLDETEASRMDDRRSKKKEMEERMRKPEG